MQSTSWETLGWRKHKLESRLWEKYQKPQICRWHHPYGRKRRTKSLLMKVKEEKWKCWLKAQHSENEDHGIWPYHFMANRWETVKTVVDFTFLGSKITADGDCSHEIKRCLFLGRKVMTNLDSILKSRDITLPTKVHLVKVFSVVMYGGEKAEHCRIDAFELWC